MMRHVPLRERETVVVGLVERYGMIDGAHHKQWLLDQIMRTLWGRDYPQWVRTMNHRTEGGEPVAPWDTGVAP